MPFNPCVRHGAMLCAPGLPPFPDLPSGWQARIVVNRPRALVEAAGSNTDCLPKVIVWLEDQRQRGEFARIHRGYPSSPEAPPSRTRMQAGCASLDCAPEMKATGYVPRAPATPAA